MHPPWIAHYPGSIHDHRPSRRVITKHVADDVAEMMRAVVAYGTGTLASSSIAPSTARPAPRSWGRESRPTHGSSATRRPRRRGWWFSVLIVHGGVGGTTAAPIARQMIEDALR
jgi:cell division protein FtsI/penicillin-binding protein 2